MSTTTFSHQAGEQVRGALSPAQPGAQTLAGSAALVGCKDDGTRRGADVSRRRSEKGWSEDRRLEQGGGSCRSQGEGSGHGADGSGGERARQETGGQGFGEVLLQSQLGLQGGRRRHREMEGEVEESQVNAAAKALPSLSRNRLKTHHHSSPSWRGEAELW